MEKNHEEAYSPALYRSAGHFQQQPVLFQPAGTEAPAEGTEAAAPADGAKVVKIGVFEPASGDNGAGGKQETLGVQYANKVQPTVEIGGETYNVELVIVDNESSNDKAPTAAANLVAQNVSIVLGSYGSGVSIAAGDVFNKAGIPAMGITCTNPQVTNGVECYFRICFLDPFQGTVLANFAKANSARRRHTASPSWATITPAACAITCRGSAPSAAK